MLDGLNSSSAFFREYSDRYNQEITTGGRSKTLKKKNVQIICPIWLPGKLVVNVDWDTVFFFFSLIHSTLLLRFTLLRLSLPGIAHAHWAARCADPHTRWRMLFDWLPFFGNRYQRSLLVTFMRGDARCRPVFVGRVGQLKWHSYNIYIGNRHWTTNCVYEYIQTVSNIMRNVYWAGYIR